MKRPYLTSAFVSILCLLGITILSVLVASCQLIPAKESATQEVVTEEASWAEAAIEEETSEEASTEEITAKEMALETKAETEEATQTEEESQLSPADKSQAERMLRAFLDARMRRDQAMAQSYLTPQAQSDYESGNLSLIGTSNPHYVAYDVLLLEGGEDDAYEAEVRIHEAYSEENWRGYFGEMLSITKVNEDFMVDSAQRLGYYYSLSYEDGAISISLEGLEVEILTMEDLPDEFSPDPNQPDLTFGVGKEGFTVAELSPGLNLVAYGTWGTHGLLGLVTMDSREVTPLSFYFEGSVEKITWSPDSRYLAAQALPPTGLSVVEVFDVQRGERFNLISADQFPVKEGYQLLDPFWSADSSYLYFTVEQWDMAELEGGGEPRYGPLLFRVSLRTGELEQVPY